MSSDDIEPYDWYSRFFGGARRGLGGGFLDDMFRGIDQMGVVREYNTPQGGKVREVGPIVYGYSMTIGPDGKPKVREFGNVRVPDIGCKGYAAGPQITAEREPLADVMTSDKQVKVVVEMPGVTKENIKVIVHDNSLESNI